MSTPRVPLDALRYGLRALEEMARAEASVPIPRPNAGPTFAPPPYVQPPARDGAALSLRLFAEGPDDATDFVLGRAESWVCDPVPARAESFFAAHVAAMVRGDDEAVLVGFPLVTWVHEGQRRTAPLLYWSGARPTWHDAAGPWRPPPYAKPGAALELPTSLSLHAPETDAEGPVWELHTGLWRLLLELDGQGLAGLVETAQHGVGALVGAAVQWLSHGPAEIADEPTPEAGPLSRETVCALVDAVRTRAAGRRGLQVHPHGMAMLLPRGDPTSGLRAELATLCRAPAPRRGPLGVFLGLSPAPAARGPLWSHGAAAPTPSQTAAAQSLEGSNDLVALCGPPGCGKTTLLHHLAAQTLVARALDETWARPPSPATPWGLVVTSTNNAAVDHALAPFVTGRDLPVGLRLGNRRTLAEATAHTLRAACEMLLRDEGPTLASARADFEALCVPVRAYLRGAEARQRTRAQQQHETERLRTRLQRLSIELAGPLPEVDENIRPERVGDVRGSLVAHAEAALRVAPIHLTGPRASTARAREKWARANLKRGRVIGPMLAALGMEVPYEDLRPDEDVVTALEAQYAAMQRTLEALDRVERALRAPARQRERDRIEAQLAALTHPGHEDLPPPPDPARVEAALVLRDAWARAHRKALLARLQSALTLVREDEGPARGRALSEVLASLSGLFPLVGCTLLSMRASFALDPGVIDRLVIDEAGQCAPIYAVPALARAKRALVTGDVAQLPPVYTLDMRLDARIAEGLDPAATEPFRMGSAATSSAQAVAEARADEPRALTEHFRSQPAIVALASCWSGHTLDVRTPPRSMASVSPRLNRAVRVVDVAGTGERAPEGIVNAAEVGRVVALVEALLRDGVEARDVAVLSPFVGQSLRIERMLQQRGVVHAEGVLVRTVHKLQGGERRVVVFSVTATAPMHLRWLAARPHLLHVATSRAQDHLVVFLDATHARHEPGLGPLVALAR